MVDIRLVYKVVISDITNVECMYSFLYENTNVIHDSLYIFFQFLKRFLLVSDVLR